MICKKDATNGVAFGDLHADFSQGTGGASLAWVARRLRRWPQKAVGVRRLAFGVRFSAGP